MKHCWMIFLIFLCFSAYASDNYPVISNFKVEKSTDGVNFTLHFSGVDGGIMTARFCGAVVVQDVGNKKKVFGCGRRLTISAYTGSKSGTLKGFIISPDSSGEIVEVSLRIIDSGRMSNEVEATITQ